MAEMFARHDIGHGAAPAYTEDQIRRLNDNYLAVVRSHEIVEEMKRLQARVRSAEALSATAEDQISSLGAHMQNLRNSASWRMTGPFRRLVGFLRARASFPKIDKL